MKIEILKYFVYILKSKVDQAHYYGHTKNLQVRLKDHNSGKVRYTKPRRPWKIHYFENYETKSEAYRRELFFKSIDGYLFLKENNII